MMTAETHPTHKQQLLSLLAKISFRLGQFTLSSGGISDYYIDCRTTTLHAEGGRLTGHAVLELLEEQGIDAEAVGGLTMGADPIVCNVATASAWNRAANRGVLPRRRASRDCRRCLHHRCVDDQCNSGSPRRGHGRCRRRMPGRAPGGQWPPSCRIRSRGCAVFRTFHRERCARRACGAIRLRKSQKKRAGPFRPAPLEGKILGGSKVDPALGFGSEIACGRCWS